MSCLSVGPKWIWGLNPKHFGLVQIVLNSKSIEKSILVSIIQNYLDRAQNILESWPKSILDPEIMEATIYRFDYFKNW